MNVKVTTEPYSFSDSNDITISTEFHTRLSQVPIRDVKSLFQNFRLNFRSRIAGCSTVDDLYKLQGKILAIDELEKFFLEILRKP
jgi:hypothetical protein